jgi:hypothetical protein
MDAIKNAFIEKGMSEKSAEFFENTIHDNFKEITLFKLERLEDKEFFNNLERFASTLAPSYEIYQGNKTTYLIQRLFFDELLSEVEKMDNDEEYAPFYSPVVVSKRDGTVVFD